MTKTEFFELISRFAQRAVPALSGRHIYLWHGPPATLSAAMPAGLRVSAIDLHQLAVSLPRAPRARSEANRLLRQTIEKELADNCVPNSQQIFLVTGCDLLSRYEVPLSPFFQLASEKRMFIFVAPSSETTFQSTSPLPAYVDLKAAAPFEYLQAAVGPAATINGNEDS